MPDAPQSGAADADPGSARITGTAAPDDAPADPSANGTHGC
jgi:hypothetical protein